MGVEAVNTYRELGVAGLFIFLYVSTVIIFFKTLREDRKETIQLTEKMIAALESSTNANRDSAKLVAEVKNSLDQSTNQSKEFLAYARGRDSKGTRS